MRTIETDWQNKKAHLITIRDITERKRAEEVLREISEMKTDFVSATSHELRTPLTIIQQGIALVLDQTMGEITSKQKEILEIVDHNVHRLTRLINDVLDISKMEARKM